LPVVIFICNLIRLVTNRYVSFIKENYRRSISTVTLPAIIPAVISVLVSLTGCTPKVTDGVLVKNVNRLPLQGNKALNPTHVMAYISGKNNKGESNLACSEAVKAGQIALKFTGAADDADGTTLANAYTESNGALYI